MMWLLVLISIHAGENRQKEKETKRAQAQPFDETPPSYRAFRIFVLLKFFGSLIYPPLLRGLLPFDIAPRKFAIASESAYWFLYIASGICVFFVLAALLRRSLQPLPGLSSAALILFRWAVFLALLLAATAHLPVFGVSSLQLLLNEISVSFVLCLCVFELSLLSMLIGQIRRLGMCLRSRPIGLAFGLCVLSLADLCNGATLNMSPHVQNVVASINEYCNYFATALWAFYIWRPEPKRLPHGLSPASRLMKWNELALKLGVSGKQAETVPFISGVEATVDAILERFKGRAG